MKIFSRIIIGCMSWGKWGQQFSTKEQIDLMNFCLENGNTSFDHADIYGDYSTEADFGKAFKESGIQRDRIQLISKCGIQLMGNARTNKVKHYNYSKEYIIESAENSLKNLQTDYLDTFLLHRPSPLMQRDEIFEAIHSLKKSGKIKHFGVSNFTPSQIDLLYKDIPVIANQIEFSLTQNKAMVNGVLDNHIKKGLVTMSWSPLGTVFKEKNDQTTRIKKALEPLCEKYNCTEDTLLLAWVLKHPATIFPVVGTTKKERINNANKALEIQLDLEDWFILLEASVGHEVA